MVVVMAHGKNGQILMKENSSIDSKQLLGQFTLDNATGLENHPKLFLMQCCRTGPIRDVDSTPFEFDGPAQGDDFLVLHSTMSGKASYRGEMMKHLFNETAQRRNSGRPVEIEAIFRAANAEVSDPQNNRNRVRPD